MPLEELHLCLAGIKGLPLHEAEYRLFCLDLRVRLQVEDGKDIGPPDGHTPDQINLFVERGRVINYTVG